MVLNKLIEYAQRRLDEACRNGEDAATIRYWVGYLDALKAAKDSVKEAVEWGWMT